MPSFSFIPSVYVKHSFMFGFIFLIEQDSELYVEVNNKTSKLNPKLPQQLVVNVKAM